MHYGWETFLKCGVNLGYCLIVMECPHPGKHRYTNEFWKPISSKRTTRNPSIHVTTYVLESSLFVCARTSLGCHLQLTIESTPKKALCVMQGYMWMWILILLNKIKCWVVLFSSSSGVLESIIWDLTSNSAFWALNFGLYVCTLDNGEVLHHKRTKKKQFTLWQFTSVWQCRWKMEKFCTTNGQKRNSLHFDNLLWYDNVIFGVLFTIQFPTNKFCNLTTYLS